jgi:hypothetical protein
MGFDRLALRSEPACIRAELRSVRTMTLVDYRTSLLAGLHS